ncbi:type II secretion system protein, partial [Bacillus pumilus]|uniref:type II secretion system protein n=1 Tax=Bacillus pumilus TaxID=1408 RepID=UPI001C931700
YSGFVKKRGVYVELDVGDVSYEVMDEKDGEVIGCFEDEKGRIKGCRFAEGMYFNVKGDGRSGGCVMIQFGRERYKLTMYLGRGGMDVEKK